MGLNLPAFADAEEVMWALLSPLGTPVVKGTPPQIVPPIILVRRVGGNSDYVTDFPQIMVTAIGGTRPQSTLLQLQVQQRVENSFATEVALLDGSVVLIDGTQVVTSGHPQVSENVDLREVAAVYQLKMRRPVVAAH
jgi:hypothetical protein